MWEHLITPWMYALGTFLVMVLVVIFLQKADADAQVYCDNAIHEFVDESRASGYISASNYLKMVNKINNTHNIYEIELIHRSMQNVPNDGSSFTDSYNAYYKDEILEILFPDNTSAYTNYPMKKGDYLQVNYYLKEPTLADQIMIFIQTHSAKTIHGSYGGYVGSTEENGLY